MQEALTDWERKREISRLEKEIKEIDERIDLNVFAIIGINSQIHEIRQSGDVAAAGVWLQKYKASSNYEYRKLCIERKGERFDLIHIPPKTLKRWEKAIERRNQIAELRARRKAGRKIIQGLYSEAALLKNKLLKIKPTRKENS